VVGSTSPTPEEKKECVDTVSRYAVDGWAIAADPHTPIGCLAALSAETACVPFLALERVAGPAGQSPGCQRRMRCWVGLPDLNRCADGVGLAVQT